MLRRVLVVCILALGLMGCGGSSPTDAPVTTPPSAEPTLTPTLAPSEGSSTSDVAGTQTAVCDAIGVRKSPSTDGILVARVYKGATVHVVGVVTGDPYTVGACGSSGDTWLKIDEINGKTIDSLYGIELGYTAAGLYQ